MNLILRPATATESPRLTTWLAQQSAPPAVSNESCLLAEIADQRLLGLLSYRIIDPDAAPVSLIRTLRRRWRIYIAPNHQRQGIAAALLHHAAARACRQGATDYRRRF